MASESPDSETPRRRPAAADQEDVQFPLTGDTHAPPERSRLERLRGIARPDLLRLALEQLLRGWEPVELSREDAADFNRMYGVGEQEARMLRAGLFEDVLQAFLADGALSPAERSYLEDLQRALDLEHGDVQGAYERLAAPHFRAALTAAIADGVVTAEERAALARLASDLHIPGDAAAQAVERTARTLLDRVWQAATASGRLPEHLAPRVREAAAALGITLAPEQERLVTTMEAQVAERRAHEERTRMERERDRAEREREREEQDRRVAADRERMDEMLRQLRAALGRSELPVVDAKIRLSPGERCHCAQPAEWHEPRPDPIDRFAEPRLACLDRGVVYVTDRRIVFEGQRMMSVIRFSDISSIAHQPDGLQVGRRADPDVCLVMRPSERVAAVASVLAHVLEASGRG